MPLLTHPSFPSRKLVIGAAILAVLWAAFLAFIAVSTVHFVCKLW